MLTQSQREELFNSVDLRKLTGQPVPNRASKAVRVDCPVHGGKGDLAIFPDHAFCYSAKCGWRGGAFDTAAILLGHYSKTDVMWPSKSFKPVMDTLYKLKAGYVKPVETPIEPPTAAQLAVILASAGESHAELRKIDKWRGWPEGTASTYRLGMTKSAIAIPVFDSKERLVSIRYRIRPALESKERPKYWGVEGANDPNILYGGFTMPPNKGKLLVLVEGEFDTISSQLAGVPTLNFINGAGWKDGRETVTEKLLNKFQRVVVAYDQDEAGGKGSYEIEYAMQTDRIQTLLWDKDLGKDPGEYVKKNGVAAWKAMVLKASRQDGSSR